MTQAAVQDRIKPVETGVPKLKHLFHKCDREFPTRTTYCGLKFPNVGMRPFEGKVTPDLCVVCSEYRGRTCPHCGD
jgi:hypothetical protein